MAEVPGVSVKAPPSQAGAPARPRRGGAVHLSVPEVDERAARPLHGAAPTRPAADAPSREPPHVIRFEGRELDPFAPRGTYLDITV